MRVAATAGRGPRCAASLQLPPDGLDRAVTGTTPRSAGGAVVSTDAGWMAHALVVAREAGASGEVPVGAVVVSGGTIIASSGNRARRDRDPTAHAEVLVLRAAAAVLGESVLAGCVLYVTLEPCAMCAGAIVLARVSRVVFGAWDDKAGMGGSVGDLLRHPRLNHRSEVTGGVCAEESGALLTGFFAARRAAKRDDPLEAL